MNRNQALDRLQPANQLWDLVIIGGGASGLGIALDAVLRGYKTLLLEAHDFASGTSSKSTKLVHGGVRYLAQGQIGLVKEALSERGLLLQNAPDLAHPLQFIIPTYRWWDTLQYGVGLWLYDFLAGKRSLGASQVLSKQKTKQLLPTIQTNHLLGGISYLDGQFDDTALALRILAHFTAQGGTALHYMPVNNFIKNESGKLVGVEAKDLLSLQTFTIQAKAIVNATGVWADAIHQLDSPGTKPTIRPSQGVHIVLDASFLPGNQALMVPKTSDGRVLFAVPWHQKLVVGTTDTPTELTPHEPTAFAHEISFILETAAQYLQKKPTPADVRAVFTGLRPLAAPTGNQTQTKEISRSHKVDVSTSGLVSIVGGKWTTYRKMADDTLQKLISLGKLPAKSCSTAHFALSPIEQQPIPENLHRWFTERFKLNIASPVHPNLPVNWQQILTAIAHQMPVFTVDVLSRRTRCLFLDAEASAQIFESVQHIMAYFFRWNEAQIAQDAAEFQRVLPAFHPQTYFGAQK